MKANDFDKQFDDVQDVTDYLDMKTAIRPELAIKRVNVDFPEWMITGLDKEAKRLGVTRQALIKFWLSTYLTPSHHVTQPPHI
jgi:predicted DNA binding CopG/RHH family protein